MLEQTDPVINHRTHTPTRSWPQRFFALCVILVILGAGLFAARYLLNSKPKAKKKPPVKMETFVETVSLASSRAHMTIKAFGKVMAANEVNLMARVAGEVVYTHPQLLPGGIIEAGETVLRLDDADYILALRQRQNALAKAEAELRMEQGRQSVAKREWKLINELASDLDASSEDLALRKPQLSQVESAIDVAKADIAKAELDLTRTIIKAPFRAVVRQKNISVGSLVSSQTGIANLASVDIFWAELSIPMQQISWLTLPGKDGKGVDIQVYSSEKKRYVGRVVRMLPDLDPNGLMARILIEIDDPMGLKNSNPPLPIGSFVSAEITGREIKNCCRLPRIALRDGETIFIAAEDNTLRVEPVEVLWSDADWVFIKDKKENRDAKVIVSKVATPIAGMSLKIASSAKDR